MIFVGLPAAGAKVELSSTLNMCMTPYSASIVGSSTSRDRCRSIRPG